MLRERLIRLAYLNQKVRQHLLTVLASEVDEGAEEPKVPGKKPVGPPPKWDEFLKARYEGGKKKVTNPNPKTKTKWPQVTAQTAMKDKNFMKRLMKEYKEWIKDAPDSSPAKQESAPEKEKPNKSSKDIYTKYLRVLKTKSLKEDQFEISGLSNGADFESSVGVAPDKIPDFFGGSLITHPDSALSVDIYGNRHHGDDGYSVRFTNAKGVTTFLRWVGEDGDGKRYIYNDTLYLKDDVPKGLGTRLFASEVLNAAQQGFDRIDCLAFRSSWGNWVGYKVWPKLGYDGEIPIGMPSKANGIDRFYIEEDDFPEEFEKEFKKRGYKEPWRIQQLYSIPGGMEWWEENGGSFSASFDLKEGSLSMQILTQYLEEKAKQEKTTVEEWMARTAAKKQDKKDPKGKKDQKGHEEIPLDDQDHDILNRIWKKIQKNGLKK